MGQPCPHLGAGVAGGLRGGREMTAAQARPVGWATPERVAAARALGWRAEAEVHDAYAALDLLSREAKALGQRLRREGCLRLAAPVTLLVAVARREVLQALGTDLYPRRSTVSAEWRIPRLHRFPTERAALLLVGQIKNIALKLGAADCVAPALRPPLLRATGVLFQTLAQFQDALLAVTSEEAPRWASQWFAQGKERDQISDSESHPRARIQLPVLKAVVQEHAKEVRMEVYDAYTLMAILCRGCRPLKRKLRRGGQTDLVRAVELAITVLRQQVWEARGKPWNSPYQHGLYGWDPSKRWLRLPAGQAVDALREELHTLAATLTRAVEFLPERWDAALSRCAGALLLVTAHLREVVQEAEETVSGSTKSTDAANLNGNSKKNHPQKAGQFVTVCDGL
jgi:hypothetical protein